METLLQKKLYMGSNTNIYDIYFMNEWIWVAAHGKFHVRLMTGFMGFVFREVASLMQIQRKIIRRAIRSSWCHMSHVVPLPVTWMARWDLSGFPVGRGGGFPPAALICFAPAFVWSHIYSLPLKLLIPRGNCHRVFFLCLFEKAPKDTASWIWFLIGTALSEDSFFHFHKANTCTSLEPPKN